VDAELIESSSSATRRRSPRRKKKTSSSSAEGTDKPDGRRKKTTKKATRATGRATTRTTARKATKKTSRRAATKKTVESEKEVVRNSTIVVNVANDEEKRIAVASDGRITDFMMTVESQKSLVNDVYRGKVVNLEPAIGAAFVDFGQGRNGFLHTSDVLAIYGEKGFTLSKLLTAAVDPEEWDESSSQPSVSEEMVEGDDSNKSQGTKGRRGGRGGRGGRGPSRRSRPRSPIESLLKVGQSVAVQVTKESIGDKGPTLTTYISIPGRFLVLMPSMARVGISRKIEDEKERKRLKKILDSLDVPEGMGIIVRTAGVKKSKEEIKRDLDYLLGVWTNFSKRLPLGRGPMPLYQESDMAICTMRDLFGPSTDKVVVDDEKTYEQVLDFTRRLMPEHEDRIHLHDGDRPIFHHYGLEQEFERIFARRIELPSGGSIVFDQAEALVAIDVNSGRTRSSKNDFEETALMTNLEAVAEITRQIRLRDLGGILVIDFIDMIRMVSNRAVERAFREALVSDRARSRVGRISQFGLLELTRQRLGPGMNRKLFANCPRCRGQGRVRTVESRAAAILRRLGSALTLKGFSSVEVRAHPDTIEYLQSRRMDRVRELEKQHEREIRFTSVPDQLDDSVLRYLRSDGREVRPGGRAKH
jgi:ribonuclease E